MKLLGSLFFVSLVCLPTLGIFFVSGVCVCFLSALWVKNKVEDTFLECNFVPSEMTLVCRKEQVPVREGLVSMQRRAAVTKLQTLQ